MALVITEQPLELMAIEKKVQDSGFGATVTFCGYVRDNNLDRQIASLEYEAYEPMTTEQFSKIEAEIADRWPGAAIEAVHRVGLLKVGELSVVIAVGAAHRGEAFAACAYAIDELKARLPIWKKETAVDGTVWREGGDDKCRPHD